MSQEFARVDTHHQRALLYCNRPLSRSAKEKASDAPKKYKHSKKGQMFSSGSSPTQWHLLCPPHPLSQCLCWASPPVHHRGTRKLGVLVVNSIIFHHLPPSKVSPLRQVHLSTPRSQCPESRNTSRNSCEFFLFLL